MTGEVTVKENTIVYTRKSRNTIRGNCPRIAAGLQSI